MSRAVLAAMLSALNTSLVLARFGSEAVPVLALTGALLGCLSIVRGVGRGGQP